MLIYPTGRLDSQFQFCGWSLMDPQPHPLLHFVIRMKMMSMNLSSGRQKCGSHKGKDLGCMEDVEMFPSKISETHPPPDWQYGDRRYHAKGWFRLTAFQGVLTLWCIAVPSASKKWTTPLSSPLLATISSAGWTHFTLHTPPEQWRNNCVDLCIFTMHISHPTDGTIDT